MKRRAPNKSKNNTLIPLTQAKWDSILGYGTYGFIHQFTTPDGNKKALKVNYVEKSMSFGGSFREVDLLKRFQHPFIVHLDDVTFIPPIKIPNKKEYHHDDQNMRQDHIYMIFEAGDYDLDTTRLDTFEDVKLTMVQILLALEFLHQNHHVHRDIKPGNIIHFKNSRTSKLIDFGMCKMIYPGCTSSVRAITAAYRPPELLYKDRRKMVEYGSGCDVWALGMTWVYLLENVELDVWDDTSFNDHWKQILQTVPRDEWTDDQFYASVDKSIPRPKWEGLVPHHLHQRDFIRVLKSMLTYDATSRASVTTLLNDTFFDDHRALINQTRQYTSEHIPSILKPYVIEGELSPERDLMIKECFFNNPLSEDKLKNPIKERMIAHAIDLIDRYIHWRIENQIPRPEVVTSQYRARVILYLCYKYFSIMDQVFPFDKIFPKMRLTRHVEQELEDWETTLVKDILKFEIYRITPYEMAKGNQKLISDYMKKYRNANEIHGVMVTL
jgi:serine/threonine protein kinase